MLKIYCSDQGVLCHATLLHESVPPITRSRIPGQLHNGSVISVKCILSIVAFDSVRSCDRIKPRRSSDSIDRTATSVTRTGMSHQWR